MERKRADHYTTAPPHGIEDIRQEWGSGPSPNVRLASPPDVKCICPSVRTGRQQCCHAARQQAVRATRKTAGGRPLGTKTETAAPGKHGRSTLQTEPSDGDGRGHTHRKMGRKQGPAPIEKFPYFGQIEKKQTNSKFDDYHVEKVSKSLNPTIFLVSRRKIL